MFKRMLLIGLLLMGASAQAQDATPESTAPTQIAFVGFASDMSESAVYLVNDDGTALNVLDAASGEQYGGMAWSPDGAHLAYVRDGELLLYTLDQEGDPVVVFQVAAPILSLYWSPAFADRPAGEMLAFTAYIASPNGPGDSLWKLIVYDLTTQTSTVIYETQRGAPTLNFTGWSPDGLLTVADVETETAGMEVFTISLDGARETLISAAEDQFDAVWSPDGTRLLYADGMFSTQFPAPAQLWLRDLDSGADVLLHEQPDATQINPEWSSDGVWAVYTSVTLGAQIKTALVFVNVVSGVRWSIDDVQGRVSWSPDGRYALFVGQNAAFFSTILYRLDLETGEVQTLIADGQFQFGSFAWRPA